MTVLQFEPWVDKKATAEAFGCSVRKVNYLLHEGMPSAMLGGKRVFRLSEVEAWMERSGHLRREA